MPIDVSDDVVRRIPGWFPDVDIMLWRCLLDCQESSEQIGDLCELGVYQGKSAILLGAYRRPEEQFVVVDLFDEEAAEARNARENAEQYRGLTRMAFERNFENALGYLPVIVQGQSGKVTDFMSSGAVRFMHIDASHLYELVRVDIANGRSLLQSSGIMVLDDFRSEHTPGVAAAAWEAVLDGLQVVAVTPRKLYATLADATPWQAVIEKWLPGSGLRSEEQVIADQRVLRLWAQRDPGPADALRKALRRLRRWQ